MGELGFWCGSLAGSACVDVGWFVVGLLVYWWWVQSLGLYCGFVVVVVVSEWGPRDAGCKLV